MSMHEIEDMVEGAIRMLDRHHSEGDLRSYFRRLYQFHDGYDTSFTRFRVMEILLARRFAYRFDISEHPDYSARQAFFDGIERFAFLYENAKQDLCIGDDEEISPIAGYIEKPYLYCEAGSLCWRRMVELGALSHLL